MSLNGRGSPAVKNMVKHPLKKMIIISVLKWQTIIESVQIETIKTDSNIYIIIVLSPNLELPPQGNLLIYIWNCKACEVFIGKE